MKNHLVGNTITKVKNKVLDFIGTQINKVISMIPINISIAPNINDNCEFKISPCARDDYLFTAFKTYIHLKNQSKIMPFNSKPVLEFDNKCEKGMQFFFPDDIVNSALEIAQSLNLLKVKVEGKISSHKVSILCSTLETPKFSFNKSINAIGNTNCTVNFDKKNTNVFNMNIKLHLILNEKFKDNNIFFKVHQLEFTQTQYTANKALDIEWFKKSINEFKTLLFNALNIELIQKGIALPTIKQISYNDVDLYVGNGYTMIGTTPKFNFTVDPDEKLWFEEYPECNKTDDIDLDDIDEPDQIDDGYIDYDDFDYYDY